VRSKFSCVRSSHDLCAHAHAHSLEGTLLLAESLQKYLSLTKEDENLEWWKAPSCIVKWHIGIKMTI